METKAGSEAPTLERTHTTPHYRKLTTKHLTLIIIKIMFVSIYLSVFLSFFLTETVRNKELHGSYIKCCTLNHWFLSLCVYVCCPCCLSVCEMPNITRSLCWHTQLPLYIPADYVLVTVGESAFDLFSPLSFSVSSFQLCKHLCWRMCRVLSAKKQRPVLESDDSKRPPGANTN